MSLTYQDCKELIDLNFPGSALWYEENGGFYQNSEWGSPVAGQLSELIKECGENFWKLEFETHKEFKTGVPTWYAYERNIMRNLNESGSSPEQAVKNLYCAINKK